MTSALISFISMHAGDLVLMASFSTSFFKTTISAFSSFVFGLVFLFVFFKTGKEKKEWVFSSERPGLWAD